jgi:hypothetical protein
MNSGWFAGLFQMQLSFVTSTLNPSESEIVIICMMILVVSLSDG